MPFLSPSRFPRLLAATCLAVLLARPVHAQTTITISSATSLNLSLDTSWNGNGGAAPGATNILEWVSTVAGAATTDTENAGLSVAGLQIAGVTTAGVTIAGTNPLTIGANGIDLSAATESLTISDLLVLGASQTWTVASGQTLNVSNPGTITGGGNNLTVSGAGNVNLASILGTGAGSLTMAGTGTLTLSGVNTYTGGTTINAGTVVAGNAGNLNALGVLGTPVVMTGGTLSVPNGFLNYDFGGTGGTILVPGSFSNVQLGSATDPAAFNFGGTLSIGAGSAVTVYSPATTTVGGLVLNSALLSSNFGLVLNAGGTVTDTGISTINGTFVNSQTRTGTGASPTYSPAYTSATVTGPSSTSGTILTFTGALNQGGGLGGAIAINGPYNPDNNGAIVTIAPGAAITFGVNSATTLNIGGALPGQFDQIQLGANATVTLAGTLTLTNNAVSTSGVGGGTFAFTGGQSYQIFTLATGATLTGSYTVTPNSSNLLAWDTSQLTSGTLSLDFTNNYWIGTTKTLSANTPSNFSTTNATPGSAQTVNLQSFSNLFLSATGAANASVQTLSSLGTIPIPMNSLSFIAGGDTLLGKLAGANTASLSLAATNSFSNQNGTNYAAGIGLVVQSGATATVTISPAVHIDLLGSQTWEIDASTLSVGSAITDTVSGISGLFSLTKTGAGILILTSTKSSYQGGTNVAGGTLIVKGASGLGASTLSGTLTLSGGTLDIFGTTQSASGLNLSSGIIMDSVGGGKIVVGDFYGEAGIVDTGAGSTAISAILTGTASLTMSGTGTLTLSGANTYSGGTAVSSGTVKLAGAGILGSSVGGTLSVSGGTVDINGTTQTVSGLSISGGIIMSTGGAGKITSAGTIVSVGSGAATLSAVLAGGVGFNQSGAGTLNVLASQLYTGTTVISAGVEELSAAGALAGGATVQGTGTLGGAGAVTGAVTVAGGGTLAPGAIGARPAGTLTLGATTFSSGSSLALNLNPAGGSSGFSKIVVNGALDLNSLGAGGVTINLSPTVANNLLGAGGAYTWSSVIAATSLTGTAFSSSLFTINSAAFAPAAYAPGFSLIQDSVNSNALDLVFSVGAIPEPATVALCSGLAVLGVAALRRRRARR